MDTVRVTNTTEFSNAVKLMKQGGKIVIPAGVQPFHLQIYSHLAHQAFENPLYIEGEPGAVIGSLLLRNTSNIKVGNLLSRNLDKRFAFKVFDCTDVALSDCKATCDHDPLADYPEGASIRGGISLRNSKRVSLKNTEVFRVGTALGVSNTQDCLVEGNQFRETLLDCMNVASNSQAITIRGNRFIQPVVKVRPAHHYDLLQFWAQTDSYQDLRDVLIENNHFIGRNTEVSAQAIFGRADYGDNPFTFRNIEVRHNFILTRHLHGISFAEGDGFNIHHNTLIFPGPYENFNSVNVPGINITKATNVKIHHNVMPRKWNHPKTDTPEFFENTLYDASSLLV